MKMFPTGLTYSLVSLSVPRLYYICICHLIIHATVFAHTFSSTENNLGVLLGASRDGKVEREAKSSEKPKWDRNVKYIYKPQISDTGLIFFNFSNFERVASSSNVYTPTNDDLRSTKRQTFICFAAIFLGYVFAMVVVYIQWRAKRADSQSHRPSIGRRAASANKTAKLGTRSTRPPLAESVHMVPPLDRYESIADPASTLIQEPDAETPGVLISSDSTHMFLVSAGIHRDGGRREGYPVSIHAVPTISIPPPTIADDGPSTGDVSGSFSLAADLPPAYEDVIDSNEEPPTYSSSLVQGATNSAEGTSEAHREPVPESNRSHRRDSFYV